MKGGDIMDKKVRKSFNVTADEYDFLRDVLAAFRSVGDMQYKFSLPDGRIVEVLKRAATEEDCII